MNNFSRTDLAAELIKAKGRDFDGVCKVSVVDLDSARAAAYGKSEGRYVTLETDAITGYSPRDKTRLARVLAGQLAALPFSLVGGVCVLAVTLTFVHLNARGKVRLCCMAAAVAHNCGQIAMAAILTATPQIALYLPILLVVGTATGYATGTLAATVLERLPHLLASATNRIDCPNAESSPGGTASEQHGAGACAPHPDRSTPSAEHPRHA